MKSRGTRSQTPGPRPRYASKSPRLLSEEWDAIAPDRDTDIDGHQDISYWRILVPSIRKLLPSKQNLVVDVGCGTGRLSAILGQTAKSVLGIDPSVKSIELAEVKATPNVRFENISIEVLAKRSKRRFDLAVANMVLQDVPKLTPFVRALSELITSNGAFVMTMTHPWFWPSYWNYASEPWFRYSVPTTIESPFVTSSRRSDGMTTHYHRPLHTYVDAFAKYGLFLTRLLEPMPTSKVEAQYPRKWEFPRFLAARFERLRKPLLI